MGLLTGLLPTPQGLPTNITPNQGGMSNFGGRVMDNLPYGGGAAYNLLNSLIHGFQGTLGEHGPAPSLAGRLLQYINPGYDQGGQGWFSGSGGPQLPTTSETNNPPMYGPAGVNPGGPQQSPSGGPSALPGVLNIGNAFNAARSPFSQTYQQALNPGSAIGPSNGITNPYDPNATHGTGTGAHVAGISPAASAFMSYVRSRHQI